jgi:hypothetical protein
MYNYMDSPPVPVALGSQSEPENLSILIHMSKNTITVEERVEVVILHFA